MAPRAGASDKNPGFDDFRPHEKSPEDPEADFRKSVPVFQELSNDLPNSIGDLLRKLVKMFEKKIGTGN